MQRLLVALLAAIDAAIAAAVGLVALLAPLTLLWTLAFGVTADWGALWPLTGTLWAFGHGVPLDVALPPELLVALAIPTQAAAFTVSITPLAFLLFTVLFAARSGSRAAKAGAWLTGVLAGGAVFTAIAALVALTSRVEAVGTSFVLAIVAPAAAYLVGALCGAVRIAWEDGDGGVLDQLHDLVDSWGEWGTAPASIVRGTAFVVIALLGVGALATALMTVLRGGEVVALFQSARVDALGAVVMTLGQLAYLPTLIVWAVAWIAGPGFAVGLGTAVSPAGTQLGVVPGIPILGLLPENSSIWMLIVVLLPIGAGAFAGWAVRSRLVWEGTPLRMGPRAVIALGIGALTAGIAALAALFAHGSMGPGRLAEVGPAPLSFALALGGEVLLGAAILLLAPRHRDELAEERTDRWRAEMGAAAPFDAVTDGTSGTDATGAASTDATGTASTDDTAPLEFDSSRFPRDRTD